MRAKVALAILYLSAICGAQVFSAGYEVPLDEPSLKMEPLTKAEIDRLRDLQLKVLSAQADLFNAEQKIRRDHGDTSLSLDAFWPRPACDKPHRRAQIHGDKVFSWDFYPVDCTIVAAPASMKRQPPVPPSQTESSR